MTFRTGIGKDSHRFLAEGEAPGGASVLVIGGVRVEGHKPFKAHSDGDVLYHSVFNAVASALGLYSIGHYFPDTSDKERGRDSREYLLFLSDKLAEKSYKVVNLSIVVECKTPKIDGLSEGIKANLAAAFNVEIEGIGITATSGEGVSPWGQGKGVEVTTVATVIKCQ
jgi:2-C-methyl-D-erythritol 2,4-cyclodiphosphate synthase